MKEKSKKKIKIEPCMTVYAAAVVVFYGVGSVLCSVKFSPEILSGNFFAGIHGKLSLGDFCMGWLYQFIPFFVLLMSGYDHLGKIYSLVVLSIRAYISGFAGNACVSEILFHGGGRGIFLFTLFTLAESMILLILVSGAVEQERFRKFYISKQKTPQKCGVNKQYFSHNFIRCGVMIGVYIIRCIICCFM